MTKKELLDEYFNQNPETGISRSQFAKKHEINPITFIAWVQKDHRYKRTKAEFTTEQRKEKVDEFFKLNPETGISRSQFARKHNIIPTTFNNWLLKDHRYQRTRAEFTKEERKNKVDEFFKLNQETGISANKFAKKHNIIQPTFHSWLLKDHRYQRIQKNYSKDPTLDTWVKKQHLDELKEKNAETVYDSSTLIDKYPELEMLLDQTNDALPYNSVVLQLDQPSTSQMTPDISWYSSQENLSMIQESLAGEDQPNTSNQTNLEKQDKER